MHLLGGLLTGLCVSTVAIGQAGNEDRLGVLVDGEEETSILIIRDYFIEDAGLKKALVVKRNARAQGPNSVVPIMRNAGAAGPASMAGIVRTNYLDVCKQECPPTGPDVTYSWRLSGAPFDTVPDCAGDTAALVEKLCRGSSPALRWPASRARRGADSATDAPARTPPPPPGTPPPPPGTPCTGWRAEDDEWTPAANTVCSGTDVPPDATRNKTPGRLHRHPTRLCPCIKPRPSRARSPARRHRLIRRHRRRAFRAIAAAVVVYLDAVLRSRRAVLQPDDYLVHGPRRHAHPGHRYPARGRRRASTARRSAARPRRSAARRRPPARARSVYASALYLGSI